MDEETSPDLFRFRDSYFIIILFSLLCVMVSKAATLAIYLEVANQNTPRPHHETLFEVILETNGPPSFPRYFGQCCYFVITLW